MTPLQKFQELYDWDSHKENCFTLGDSVDLSTVIGDPEEFLSDAFDWGAVSEIARSMGYAVLAHDWDDAQDCGWNHSDGTRTALSFLRSLRVQELHPLEHYL